MTEIYYVRALYLGNRLMGLHDFIHSTIRYYEESKKGSFSFLGVVKKETFSQNFEFGGIATSGGMVMTFFL